MKFISANNWADEQPQKEVPLSENPEVIRQIRASREDRKAGRVYSGAKALDVLRAKVQEYEHGTKL